MTGYFPEESRLWPDDRAREEARRELEEYEHETERIQEFSDEVPVAPRARVEEREAA